jgi:hypothetical protein
VFRYLQPWRPPGAGTVSVQPSQRPWEVKSVVNPEHMSLGSSPRSQNFEELYLQ